ncbi:MAG: Stp1/IreP family PP2C-type Ser/Thr phosphatase [Halanaerobiales bacterium]
MQIDSFTDKGHVRQKNEDSFLIKFNPFPIFAVADGMGGHRGGDIASQIAVDTINNYNFNFDKNKPLNKVIKNVINKANENIIKIGNKNSSLFGMGTTLSMGIIKDNILYTGHVGDSRIYLYRKNNLKRVTNDDSLVNRLIEQGKISSKQAFNHPRRHILLQALGTEDNLEIETNSIKLQNHDILMACTDGLTDMIKEKTIKKIIQNKNLNAKSIADTLGERALQKGGNDNITVIVGIIN